MRGPATLITLLLSSLSQAEIYKWVDEHGKIQYSDKPPASNPNKGYKTLNKQGVAKTQQLDQLGPEQRKQREAELLKQQQASLQQLEDKRRDSALLATFSHVREIDMLRDRNLEQITAAILSDKQRRENIQKRLDPLLAQAKKLESAKRSLPEDVAANITLKQGELMRIDTQLAKYEQNAAQIRERAEADKKRLIELRGASVSK